jgi:hypothetical protein
VLERSVLLNFPVPLYNPRPKLTILIDKGR